MYTNTKHIIKTNLLDLKNYSLPTSAKDVKLRIYDRIPSKVVDIYDFDMIFHDQKTMDLIRSGSTIGCFYIESPGMRSLLKRLSCDTFEMLTAASSVIRPGVAESGMMQEFIDRHHDPSRRKYLVPEMEEVLGETYGVMIYQEDVIKVAHKIAGLSLEEADLLRRAMSGKMRSHTAMERIKINFFSSCKLKGHSEEVSNELWRQIESFAGYAFCKAHSGSFALLSYQVAYLKSHYPAEFMAGVLSNRGGYYAPAVYIQECKRLGLKVNLPSVNKSEYEYTGKGKEIQIGLMAIGDLSNKTMLKIITERTKNGNFESLLDFFIRTKIGYSECEILIICGACDCFNQTRPTLNRLLGLYNYNKQFLHNDEESLFGYDHFNIEDQVTTSEQYSIEKICKYEYQTFGYMVTQHPLYFYRDFTKQKNIVKAIDMKKYNSKKVEMIGWFMTSKRIRTKKGDIMKFLSLEDETGTFEAVIFPKVYSQCAEQTMSMGPYLLFGRVDYNMGNNLVVEKLTVLSNREILSMIQKDSVENNYFGDVEHFSNDEIDIVKSLDFEKYKTAYL
ncbi:MAG: hypothetical protein IPH62_15365 [Ignavibacteriae bacterium]|nr:hypothetical protein [Ignavibacteriota bacterium]